MIKGREAAPVLMRLALRQRMGHVCFRVVLRGLNARSDRRSGCSGEAVNSSSYNAT